MLEGLCRVLEPECEIAGTAADGRGLLAAAERLKPDVVVADISMPLLNGVNAVRQIKKTAHLGVFDPLRGNYSENYCLSFGPLILIGNG